MPKNKVWALAFAFLLAMLVSVPLSWAFVANTSYQDLSRIDANLARYQSQIQDQTGSELETALLVAQLAGESLSISLKTIDGELVEFGEPNLAISEIPSDEFLLDAVDSAQTFTTSDSQEFRVRSVSLADEEFLILSSSLADHMDLVESGQQLQLLAIAVSCLLGVAIAWWVTRFQESRLKLARLQSELDFERRRQDTMNTFLGDVAHELKTPLTVIRGYSEILERQSSADSKPSKRIAEEVVRMEQLLSELLRMAQLREVQSQGVREVDLAQILELQIGDLRAIQRSRPVELFIQDRPKIKAQQLLVEMLLSNIFSNIRKHTESSAAVYAELKLEGDEILLAIEDGGPGLTDKVSDLETREPKRYTPFRNREVEGQGLGMAIIADIVSKLGGQVEFEKSDRLGGLRVSLSFTREKMHGSLEPRV